jgi:hypothetical protein
VRTTFIETLCQLAEQEERIWLLTGDLGYSILERFANLFPERFVNVGVAEQNMVGRTRFEWQDRFDLLDCQLCDPTVPGADSE